VPKREQEKGREGGRERNGWRERGQERERERERESETRHVCVQVNAIDMGWLRSVG